MSDALRVNIYEQDGSDALVRGLPAEVLHRLGAPQRWCSEAHAWKVESGAVRDLCALLQNEGIQARTFDRPPPQWTPPPQGAMTPEEAEAATAEMRGLYGIIETKLIRMTHVAAEFVKRRGWVALGYDSLDDYSRERLPFTLPREVRKEVVAKLVAEGISVRAAAVLARTSEATARRDATASNDAVDPLQRSVGMDGRDRPARRTYEPVEPSAVWVPREPDVTDNVVPLRSFRDEGCVDEVIVLLQESADPPRRFEDLERAVAYHRASIDSGARSLP